MMLDMNIMPQVNFMHHNPIFNNINISAEGNFEVRVTLVPLIVG